MKNKNTLIIEYNTTPNKENFDYAFQRLITELAIATKFNAYKDDWELLNKCLTKVINWAITYDETKTLANISLEEIKEIDKVLYELDGKYLSASGLYIENAYIWFHQLTVLRNNFIERNETDGRI